ncbi:hypothetical protein HFQ13_11095 [Acidithiobacillus sp. VAN18-1]|uniref:O-antigen ligase-related domain-containing protein n=1 Tax=Igneacidithiobacillus copahuensis TaxID=2724909 RepID=A0AAE3CKC3_9PROT|nr:O-antigen ligase family protein [Igneacidithiobacillus copahuensis]MBU2788737.1 hypothetical protein [Igneacidithiobacillus copahuensis]MBU2797134.1 hypothetical protein [Acidithiobacillus sp. VAN18-2]
MTIYPTTDFVKTYLSKNNDFIDYIGFVFLLLTVFSIPLSIFATEVFFVFFFFSFMLCKRYLFIRHTKLNYTVAALILISIVSLSLHQSAHALFDFKQSMYVAISPIISAYSFNQRRYILLLRAFIVGMLTNLAFGILDAFGVDAINTHGQGNIGVISFHIYSSMLISMAILLLLLDFFYKRIVPSYKIRTLSIIGLSWQLFTTTGRTGQGILVILSALIVYWYAGKIKYLLFSLIPILTASILYVSSESMKMWVAAYSQIHETITAGYHNSDIGLRFLFTKSGIMMLISHPFFGVGIGQFRKTFYRMISEDKIPHIPADYHYLVGPTSSYIAYISEFGLAGLIALVLLFYASFDKIMRTSSKDIEHIGILFLLWFFIGRAVSSLKCNTRM